MAPITHLVSFRYKPSTSSAEKHLVASSFLALQDQCTLHDRPYVSVTGGANNSSEGADKGLEVRPSSLPPFTPPTASC